MKVHSGYSSDEISFFGNKSARKEKQLKEKVVLLRQCPPLSFLSIDHVITGR